MSVVNMKNMLKIVESTPTGQPILITGYHGIGKSESITEYFQSRGYLVITLFVGQMADAGDIIGLPERVDVEYQATDKDGNVYQEKTKITEFCPPKWWPMDATSKVVMFFDEVNRGKPEIMQCLMDMILNKKLNGRELPENTHIIGSMNPLEDGYYQVEELDPAFLDRWNIYELRPTVEEWIFWAARNGVDDNIIGFISKYQNHLDPPKPKEAEVGNVYPSRRSWVKVSNYIKYNSTAERQLDDKLFERYIDGVVGIAASGDYMQYLNTEIRLNINVGEMLVKMDRETEKKLRQLDIAQILHLNVQIALWMENNEETLTDHKSTLDSVGYHLETYLSCIPAETMVQFFDYLSDAYETGRKWPELITESNVNLGNRYVASLHGEELDDEDEA